MPCHAITVVQRIKLAAISDRLLQQPNSTSAATINPDSHATPLSLRPPAPSQQLHHHGKSSVMELS